MFYSSFTVFLSFQIFNFVNMLSSPTLYLLSFFQFGFELSDICSTPLGYCGLGVQALPETLRLVARLRKEDFVTGKIFTE